MNIYAFYNNKGGVGKTTLAQNAAALYAENNKEKQVIVIDLCPQANISQFLLGGGHKGYQTTQQLQQSHSRKSIVGFMDWILKGNSGFKTLNTSYLVQVSKYNKYISDNLYLVSGDSFLESLSLALNYAVINPANKKAWPEFMTAIRRLCELEFLADDYEDLTVFIDCNPSFSIYTQMGLVSSDRVIVPMMADFSSLEGIKSLMMLLYGEYPSEAIKKYADDIITFTGQVTTHKLELPTLYEFVFNNYTTNAGIAQAFKSVRDELSKFCFERYKLSPQIFTPIIDVEVKTLTAWKKYYISDTKDFHTSAKVSASLGIPLHKLPKKTKYLMPDGKPVDLPRQNYEESLINVRDFVDSIE